MDVRVMTQGIREGRKDAFEAFYSGYADRMFRYLIVSVKGNEERARDVLQDALLRVVRHLPPLDTSDDLWRYLSAIMRSALVDDARRTERHRPGRGPLTEERALEERANDQMFVLLDQALAALPEDDRRILEDHYFRGATQTEIAGRIDSTQKGLAMRFSRLRRRVREFILEGLRRG